MRPQVTNYSESAKNRESVMSLGSIAHLQYYFARTGLLDGKGAQVARPDMLRRKSSNNLRGDSSRAVSMSAVETPTTEAQSGLLSPTMAAHDSCAISDAGLTDSPIEQEGEVDWESEMMLPPTVSTYNQKPIYVPPPPDLTMLRRELTEALEDALKVLKETDSAKAPEGVLIDAYNHETMLTHGRISWLVRDPGLASPRHHHTRYPSSTKLLYRTHETTAAIPVQIREGYTE